MLSCITQVLNKSEAGHVSLREVQLKCVKMFFSPGLYINIQKQANAPSIQMELTLT